MMRQTAFVRRFARQRIVRPSQIDDVFLEVGPLRLNDRRHMSCHPPPMEIIKREMIRSF